jgi:hypothetical protein
MPVSARFPMPVSETLSEAALFAWNSATREWIQVSPWRPYNGGETLFPIARTFLLDDLTQLRARRIADQVEGLRLTLGPQPWSRVVDVWDEITVGELQVVGA